MNVIEWITVLSSLVDIPVTVAAFVWALRIIERQQQAVMELLEECLRSQKAQG